MYHNNHFNLSDKELRAAHLYAQGRSRLEMSKILKVGRNSIGTFINGVFKKLDVHSKKEMIQVLYKMPDLPPNITIANVMPENPYGLMPRQFECAQLMLQGLDRKQIARAMLIDPGTVSDHKKAVFKRTGTDNMIDLREKLGKLPTGTIEMRNEIAKLQKQLVKLEKTKQDFETAHNFEEANKHLLDSVIPDLNSRILAAKAHDAKKQHYISKLEEDVRNLKQENTMFNKANKLRIKELETDLEELTKLNQHLKELETKLEKLKKANREKTSNTVEVLKHKLGTKVITILELKQQLAELEKETQWQRETMADVVAPPTHCSLCADALKAIQ